MKTLLNEFKKQYDFCYEVETTGSEIAGANDALDYFDNCKSSDFIQLVRDFVEYRGDFISSDREAIAFVFALDSLNLIK